MREQNQVIVNMCFVLTTCIAHHTSFTVVGDCILCVKRAQPSGMGWPGAVSFGWELRLEAIDSESLLPFGGFFRWLFWW